VDCKLNPLAVVGQLTIRFLPARLMVSNGWDADKEKENKVPFNRETCDSTARETKEGGKASSVGIDFEHRAKARL